MQMRRLVSCRASDIWLTWVTRRTNGKDNNNLYPAIKADYVNAQEKQSSTFMSLIKWDIMLCKSLKKICFRHNIYR